MWTERRRTEMTHSIKKKLQIVRESIDKIFLINACFSHHHFAKIKEMKTCQLSAKYKSKFIVHKCTDTINIQQQYENCSTFEKMVTL